MIPKFFGLESLLVVLLRIYLEKQIGAGGLNLLISPLKPDLLHFIHLFNAPKYN